MAMGKRNRAAAEGIEPLKLYPISEAVKLVKERARAKFDETIEVAMNLGVDPRHADQMVRGVVSLPNGTGRTLRVGVFARGAKADEAKQAGADVVGAEDLVEKVQGGTIEFDRCIATPDMMPLVGRLGKVLGPRGMMPNPKVGTVTNDVAGAVKDAKGGAVEFRVEKAGIIQAGVGKASFDDQALIANIRAFTDAVQKARPAGAKGTFVQRVALSSTMGPGVKVDPASLSGAYERAPLSIPAGEPRRVRPPADEDPREEDREGLVPFLSAPVRDCRRRVAGLIDLPAIDGEGRERRFPVRTSWPMRRPVGRRLGGQAR